MSLTSLNREGSGVCERYIVHSVANLDMNKVERNSGAFNFVLIVDRASRQRC